MKNCKNCIHRGVCALWNGRMEEPMSPDWNQGNFYWGECSLYDTYYAEDDTLSRLLDDIDTIIANNVVEQHYHGNHFVPTSVNIGIVGELKKLREKYGE